jgi:hypothetical protein
MVVGSLLAAAVMFAVFIAIEQRVEKPMVPLGLFRSRMFTGANITALIVAFLISGLAFTGTMYFQSIHDYSPIKSGATMLPMVAVMMVMSPITGSLVGRVQIRTLIMIGLLISGSGALMWLRGSVDADYLTVLPAMLLVGLGNSFLFAPMTTGVMNSVPAAQAGLGSAVNGAVRETGFAFGVAVLGALANQTYHDSFRKADEVEALREQSDGALTPVLNTVGDSINFAGNWVRSIDAFNGLPAEVVNTIDRVSSQAFVDGMHAAFIVTGALTVVAAVGTWLLIGPDTPLHRPAVADEPEAEPVPGVHIAPGGVGE